MIKLTTATGKTFYVRITAISVIREPTAGEYVEEVKSVVHAGGEKFGVRENLAHLALSMGAG